MLIVDGIDLNELLSIMVVVKVGIKIKCVVCLVKYSYVDENGEIKIWIGQGCILVVIKKVMDE